MDKIRRLSIDLSPLMFAALERRSKADNQSKAGILRSALRAELLPEIEEENRRQSRKSLNT